MPTGPLTHLTVRSPSPSTISYTVSSLSSPRSIVVNILRHIARAIISFYAILALLSKAQDDGFMEAMDVTVPVPLLLRYSLLGDFIKGTAQSFNWWLLSFTSMLTLYLCLRRDYTEESLLVLQGLGIQTSTTSPYFFVASTTTFIPTTQIQDIVIHEAFRGLEVRFYLAVIVENATEFVVVFPHLLPKRAVLEEVWRGSRKCLYGSTG